MLHKLTIIFNTDFEENDQLIFELYNTVSTNTDTYTYTWVTGQREKNEVIVSPSFINPGDSSAISYKDAISLDYGKNDWTIIRASSNILELTTVSENTEFRNASIVDSSGSDLDVFFSYEEVPNPIPITKTSYYYEFTDIEGVEHRVNIEYAKNPQEWVEIKGSYTLQVAPNDELLTPLRPKEAVLNIEANSDLTFSDLYTEEEKVYKVTVIRNSVNEFIGWLSSDGLYEDYVTDKWVITLSAIDGLGYLKELSYVDDIGSLYSGKQTDIEKISNTLAKTDLDLDFRTSINIYYNGLSGVDVLSNTYFNTERYTTNDNNEPLSCEKVLLSVLQKYNAVIVQEKGVWKICRPNEIFEDSNITFYNYDSLGVLKVGENTVSEDIAFNLGSQIDDYYPHHINSNQRKSIKNSLGIYRTVFKYGRVFPYFSNVNLVWTNPTTLPDWTINTGGGAENFIFPYQDLQSLLLYTPASIFMLADTGDYTVDDTPRIQFEATFSNTNNFKTPSFLGLGTGGATFNAKVKYVKGANTYHLTKEGKWVTSNPLIQHAIGAGEKNFTLKVVSDEVPESDGDIRIELWSPGFGFAIYPLVVHSIALSTYIGEEQSQGQKYTIEKIANFTPRTDEVQELLNGDVPNNTYYSTIYENDQATATEFWSREGSTEIKPLLRIMVEDRMRMNWKPRVVFEGDVYGYVPFLSRVNLNNIKDKMMLSEWGYNASTNITTIKLIEIMNENFNDDDVIFSIEEDYGETVKPTIKG